MEDFYILKARREQYLHEAELLENEMNTLVNRVIKIFEEIDFDYEGDKCNYDSPYHVIVQNYEIPKYFDNFELEEGELVASGIYHGSYGYSVHSSVRFPQDWINLPDDILRNAMIRSWKDHLQNEKIKKADLERKKAEKEKAEYERLKEKFGDA